VRQENHLSPVANVLFHGTIFGGVGNASRGDGLMQFDGGLEER
jgi:hypothetical protein